MSNDLEELIKISKSVSMTEAQKEEQRRSFAYGNAGLENDLITREMIDQQAEKLKSQDG